MVWGVSALHPRPRGWSHTHARGIILGVFLRLEDGSNAAVFLPNTYACLGLLFERAAVIAIDPLLLTG